MKHVNLYGSEESKIEEDFAGQSIFLHHVLVPREHIIQPHTIRCYIRQAGSKDELGRLITLKTQDITQDITVDNVRYSLWPLADSSPFKVPTGFEVYLAQDGQDNIAVSYSIS
jgi:hypothetical protein